MTKYFSVRVNFSIFHNVNFILTLDWNIFLLGLCPFTFLLPKSSVTNIPFWRNIFDDEACLSIFSLSRTLRKVAIIGRTCNYYFFREIELSFFIFLQCPKSNQTKFFTIFKDHEDLDFNMIEWTKFKISLFQIGPNQNLAIFERRPV